jgi:hypothetical protein
MGRPAEAPKPKKDTSRVQVTAAKPGESPRPTVKLQRDPAPAAAGIPAAAPVAARVTAGASDGGGGGILSLVAMVLSLGVAGFLAYLAFM